MQMIESIYNLGKNSAGVYKSIVECTLLVSNPYNSIITAVSPRPSAAH